MSDFYSTYDSTNHYEVALYGQSRKLPNYTGKTFKNEKHALVKA